MLQRAVTRTSLRAWSYAPARPPLLGAYRGFAKNRPPRPPPNRPSFAAPQHAGSSRHGPTAIKQTPGAASGIGADGATRGSVHGAVDQAGKPQPSQGRQGVADEGHDAETTSELPYSKEQAEFDTPASAEQNASPTGSKNPSPNYDRPGPASIPAEEPQIPLHDLTKGIPSTIDAELNQAARKQSEAENEGGAQAEPAEPAEAAQEPRPTSGGRGGRGEREMPASAYQTSAERRRNRMMSWALAWLALAGATGAAYLGRNWATAAEEAAHPDAASGWSVPRFWRRLRARAFSTLDYYVEPAFPKLLPDPDPAYARPYTLVVSLEDLLVKSEWTRENGWRLAKRPGLDYFLRYLSQYYEIVIFTSVPSALGGPLLMKLDPFGIVPLRLFREATRYQKSQYVKDLSFLNRDLSKIILLDTVEAHAAAQPDNAIILPKWDGAASDTKLVGLIPFLEYLAAVGPPDTRKVLASFAGADVAAEFAAREAAARQAFEAQRAAAAARGPRRSVGGALGAALGIRPGALGGGMGVMERGPDGEERFVPVPSASEELAKGKMLQDTIRERGQAQYEAMEREIRENTDKWLAEIAADEEKMKRESLRTMASGAAGWFGWAKGAGEEEGAKKEAQSAEGKSA